MSDEADVPFWQLPVPDEAQDWRKRAARIKDRLEVLNAAEATAETQEIASNTVAAAASTDNRRLAREPTRAEIIRLERAARDRARTEATSSTNDVSPVKVHTTVRHSPVKLTPSATNTEAASVSGNTPTVAPAPTKVEVRGADTQENYVSPRENQNQTLNHAEGPNVLLIKPRVTQPAASLSTSAEDTLRSRQQPSSYTTEARRAEIAELMATLQATRAQANGAASELAAQRQRAASRAQEADAARASFVSAQERSDSAALEKQTIALAQSSPRLPTLSDERGQYDGSAYDSGSGSIGGRSEDDGAGNVSDGGASNQLHQGMVVVQGRRDLISQLRVGGSRSAATDSGNDFKDTDFVDDKDGSGDEDQSEEARRIELARAAAALAAEEGGPDYDLLDDLLREQHLKANTSSRSSNSGRDAKKQDVQPGAAESQRQQSLKALVQLADLSEPDEGATASQPYHGHSAEGDEQGEVAVPPDLRSAFARVGLLDASAEAKESGNGGYRRSNARSGSRNSDEKTDEKPGNVSAGESSESSKVFECPLCMRTFKAMQHLKLHSNVHKREAMDVSAAVALHLPKAAEAKGQAKEEQDSNRAGHNAISSIRRNHLQPAAQTSTLSPVLERRILGSNHRGENGGAGEISHEYGNDDKAAQSESKEGPVDSETDVDESPEELAKRLQAGSGQGPNMEAMHRLWGILQSEAPHVNGHDGGRNAGSDGGGVSSAVEAGILQEVLGGNHPLMGQRPSLPASAPSGSGPAPVEVPALSAEEEANMAPEQRQKRQEYLDALAAREAAEHAEADAAAAAARQRQQRIEVC